ncbi:hypothetical protein SPRG_22143 [Saprolegnia parasitica CBS 223.65]|uniref:Membrane-associated protein n=1 Tax=Saprolegnia parasitica (strain CBS 223.65) TaxID=695850 RepID=A0A067CSX2_SAPPC|nr:hypothetical protein SPRG_22143 [Saprolegnia parasitica CBS 223.65]KDO29897.1 hypothetical protein SPRG_22143 [Saprolegnia parasitica CBS 223.65]|eukprot:XP_012199571.1 hypothetical protein SPRG_22143 [Saprolegnia parasitica CBS 223.65]
MRAILAAIVVTLSAIAHTVAAAASHASTSSSSSNTHAILPLASTSASTIATLPILRSVVVPSSTIDHQVTSTANALSSSMVALWIIVGGVIALVIACVFFVVKACAKRRQPVTKLSVIDTLELRQFDQLVVPLGPMHSAHQAPAQDEVPRSSRFNLRPLPYDPQ